MLVRPWGLESSETVGSCRWFRALYYLGWLLAIGFTPRLSEDCLLPSGLDFQAFLLQLSASATATWMLRYYLSASEPARNRRGQAEAQPA